MRLEYNNLTDKEKEALIENDILNGCGPKGPLEWIVPEFDFKPCCFAHDFDTWVGGTQADRRRGNWDFMHCMIKRVNNSAKYGTFTKRVFRVLAHTYFGTVAVWSGVGHIFGTGYHYGNERTQLDIDNIMKDI